MFRNVLFVALTITSLSALAQRKKALLIALEQYNLSEWSPIHSTNDTLLLKPALLTRGFLSKNITVINDSKGKRKDLLNAIEAFVQSCQANDAVLFHYSGHGQQVADVSGDEPDGYDESIVPIDASATFQENGYKGERHILDDELAVILEKLRQKIGPGGDLLVTIDACYSGTATRLLGYARGATMPIASNAYMQSHPLKEAPNNKKTIDLSDSVQTPYTVFSATSAYVLNHEMIDNKGIYYGPLSYALAQELSHIDKSSNYSTLFSKIKRAMAITSKEQTPMMEGSGNRIIFNGTIVPRVNFFLPASYKASTRTYTLNYGQLHGFFEKTKVAIYDLDVHNFESATAVATGEVVSSSAASCSVKVDQNLSQRDPLNKKLVITQPSFGSLRIAVRMDLDGKPQMTTALRTKLAAFPVIQLVNDASAELVIESDNSHLKKSSKPKEYVQIVDSKNQVIESFTADASRLDIQLNNVIHVVLRYLYGRYLRELEISNSTFRSALNLKLADCTISGGQVVSFNELPPASFTVQEGYYKAPTGKCFRLEVRNNSTTPFYFSILLVNPQNKISFLIPDEETIDRASDYHLSSQVNRLILPKSPQAFLIQPPFGKDVYKLIATSEPLDLRAIFNSGIKNIPLIADSPSNALFQLLRNAGMGLKTPPPAKQNIDVKTIIVEVIK